MAPELASQGREPVAGAARMLDQARDPKLAQPLCEHARGHLRNPRRKLAIGHCVVAKLPDDPQRPAPAQHVEQRKKASVPVSIGARCARTCGNAQSSLARILPRPAP